VYWTRPPSVARAPLQAADALQLAAGLQWTDGPPHGLRFVTLDSSQARPRRREFTVVP
jgi:hypothetical protein